MSTSRESLRENIQAFETIKPELLEKHKGQYALLHDATLVDVFPDKESARVAAAELFPEGDFAISPEIGAPAETLGAIGLYVTPVRV